MQQLGEEGDTNFSQKILEDHLSNNNTKNVLFPYPEFSTSGSRETLVGKIASASICVKNALCDTEYSGCGIPEIQLMGVKEDWVKLVELINGLDESLSFWKESLVGGTEVIGILEHFVRAFDGEIDVHEVCENSNLT